jgi:SAM-dependent methyltransferase
MQFATKDRNLMIFERLYGAAEAFDDLPWHDPEPPELLVDAMASRANPGTALDIGCGGGTYSLYMAGRGYAVTGLDFMPQAIEMTANRASNAGCAVETVQASVLTWSTDRLFDVILDVGCLHSLPLADRTTYSEQLCRWLAPGGDFVLIHCGSRGWWDRWPIGPHRIARDNVVELFAPELTLHDYRDEKLRLPAFIGCSALAARYWFKRA